MAHVFISYKHNDEPFINAMVAKLTEAGIDVWKAGDNIDAGTVWRDVIDQKIREAFAVIVAMTPDARLSEYVTYEWAFAMGLGKPLVPIILTKTDLHQKLEPLQVLNFTVRFAEPWDRLIERLKELEAEAVSAPTTDDPSHYGQIMQKFEQVASGTPTRGRAAPVTVYFPFGIGERTLSPTAEERNKAWLLYTELSTRITTRPLDEEFGSLREALTSIYQVFQFTRDVIKRAEPDEIALSAVAMLDHLAGFNSKWHPLLSDYEKGRPDQVSQIQHEKVWDRNMEFRRDLKTMQGPMRDYSAALQQIALAR